MRHTAARTDIQDGFVFRGGVLALELVNTEIAVRGKPQDLLNEPRDLARWWAVAQERYLMVVEGGDQEAATPQLLVAVKTLRGALRRVCAAVTQAAQSDEADRAVINQVLCMAHITLIPASNVGLRQTYTLQPGGSALLFSIALSGVRLLTDSDFMRLHKCRNERCVLFFYDTTKSGTRQWCSLDCFNRTRSSENYRRRKAAAQT